jgi:hypothetical protein
MEEARYGDDLYPWMAPVRSTAWPMAPDLNDHIAKQNPAGSARPVPPCLNSHIAKHKQKPGQQSAENPATTAKYNIKPDHACKQDETNQMQSAGGVDAMVNIKCDCPTPRMGTVV